MHSCRLSSDNKTKKYPRSSHFSFLSNWFFCLDGPFFATLKDVMEKLVEENWANFPKAKEVESEQLCLFSRLRVSSTTSHQFLLPVPPSFPSSSAAVLVSQYLLIQMTNKIQKGLNYLMTSLRYIKRRWSTVLFLPSPSMAGYSLLSRKKAINIKASKHYCYEERELSFKSGLHCIKASGGSGGVDLTNNQCKVVFNWHTLSLHKPVYLCMNPQMAWTGVLHGKIQLLVGRLWQRLIRALIIVVKIS